MLYIKYKCRLVAEEIFNFKSEQSAFLLHAHYMLLANFASEHHQNLHISHIWISRAVPIVETRKPCC